jgi:putative transposase
MYLAGVPCHVVQRGNNRDACFFGHDDYRVYLDVLRDACLRYQVKVHAYVLMTNHVHLLLTPQTSEGISRVMQSIGRRYVQYVNKTYRRCGTLWESRHKASLVDAEQYLLACYRYIELNPVAAEMVAHPGAYRWSSYGRNAWGQGNDLVCSHEIYDALGASPAETQQRYRELFSSELSRKTAHEIRVAASFSMPLGNERFKKQIESVLGRPLGHVKRGRPAAKVTPKRK